MSGTKRFERSGQPSAAKKTVDWLAVERSPEFTELVQERKRFLVPATIVFLVGSIGYLLLAAFVPSVMDWQITDGLPFAWVAAVSQVLLTWALTWAYLRKADRDLEPLEQRAAAIAERGDGERVR
jgi:uncharacterized membrane protein (DUF485 family)